ncbi:SCP2 sterol-binding domain-containing protein [Acidimangrovimonas pyrenivorans]|uniref:SCP2 sterol-binding domain-containing protein n=1 Tax=Acidimangrovimonas pyrenivorans TaxID=2030798 RepID=A0ABV7AGF3_9RHOB
MSDVINAAVEALSSRFSGGFDGVAKFVVEGEGALVIDGDGVRASETDAEADVTLTANTDTFKAILEGDMNPTSAFMSGKLAVDGNMGLAMQLGSALA